MLEILTGSATDSAARLPYENIVCNVVVAVILLNDRDAFGRAKLAMQKPAKE
jgi:hypothetical protein